MAEENTYWKSKEMIRDIFQGITTSAILVIGWWVSQNRNNNEGIEKVERRQEVVKTTLEEKMADDVSAIEITLYGNWKWLDKVASDSGTMKDWVKVQEAKKVYEDFVRKKSQK